MKNFSYTMLILLVLVLSIIGCGNMSRWWAGTSGYSTKCVDGVSYIQFTSGASVAYNINGTIKTCK